MSTPQKDNKKSATKVIGGIFRFSYCHVFTPTSIDPDSEDKKYSVSLLLPKSNKVLIDEIKKAIKAAADVGKEKKWSNKLPANLRSPLRDGDVEKPGDPIYKGHYFINCNSASKPGVVDAERNPITSEDEFYSGCYGRASINFFPYSFRGNNGIGCGLNHLQKTRDGERLGGRASVDEDFNDDFNDDEATAGSTEDNDLLFGL